MTTDRRGDLGVLRALAHPLRLRILDLLRLEGPSTATLLARRLGETSGTTSYHLRQLARQGHVEEAASDSHRERWWRARGRQVTLRDEPEMQAARRVLAELIAGEGRALDRFLAGPSRSQEWDDASFVALKAFRLTPAELDALRGELDRLFAGLRPGDATEAPGGAAPVRLLALGFPEPPASATS